MVASHVGEGAPCGVHVWHGAVTLASSLAIQVLNIATGVITARALGPSGKGALTAVLLWPALLVSVGSLGFSEAVTYFTARMPNRAADVSATGMVVALAQAATLSGLGLFLIPVLLGHYGQKALAASQLFLIWIPLNLVTQTAMSALQGRQKFRDFNAVRLIVVIATVIGLGLLLVNHAISLISVVEVYLGANIVAMVMAVSIAWRRFGLNILPDASLVKPMVLYGLKSHTGNLSSFANERADQALVSIFLAPSSLGLYATAVTLTSPLGLIGGSLGYVAMPAVASSSDEAVRRAVMCRFVRACVLLSVVAAVVMFASTPWLLQFFFGRDFVPASDSTRILLVAGIALATNRVVSAVVRALGRPLLAGGGEFLATGVTILGLAVLLPSLKIVGASIASLAAYTTSLAFMAWQLHRRYGVSLADLFLPRFDDWKQLALRTFGRISPRPVEEA